MINFLAKIFIKDYKQIHNSKVRAAYGTMSSVVGICVNLLLSVLKLIVGMLTSSMAIIADSINNFSDTGSSIVSLVSFKISSKPADRDHPFGHARIEYISSMIVSFLILLVGFEMLSNSVSVIFGLSEAEKPDFSLVSLLIIGASILLKLFLGLFQRKIGKRIDSSVIVATSMDSFFDSISTLTVLISAIIVKLTDFALLDSIVGLLVSSLILYAGAKILIETKNSILGEAPVQKQLEDINNIIKDYPVVLGVHDLMIHNYGPSHYIASFHAEVDGEQNIYQLHDMIDNLEKRISGELNMLCTIHMDPIVTNNEVVNELKKFAIETIKNDVSEDFNIHDFRVVVGESHTNMIFDVVVPFECKLKEEEIVEKIKNAVSSKRENVFCVITVDRG